MSTPRVSSSRPRLARPPRAVQKLDHGHRGCWHGHLGQSGAVIRSLLYLLLRRLLGLFRSSERTLAEAELEIVLPASVDHARNPGFGAPHARGVPNDHVVDHAPLVLRGAEKADPSYSCCLVLVNQSAQDVPPFDVGDFIWATVGEHSGTASSRPRYGLSAIRALRAGRRPARCP